MGNIAVPIPGLVGSLGAGVIVLKVAGEQVSSTSAPLVRVLIYIGFSALWIVLQSSGFYPLSLVSDVGSMDPTSVALHHLVYASILCALAAAIALLGKRGRIRFLNSRVAIVLMGVFCVAGHLLMLLARGTGLAFEASVIAGSIFTAAFAVLAIILWGCATTGISGENPFVLVALSYLLAQVIQGVYYGLGLPQGPLMTVAPVLCALGLYAAEARHSASEVKTPLSKPGSDSLLGVAKAYCGVQVGLLDGGVSRDVRSGLGVSWRVVIPALLMVYFIDVFVRLLVGEFSGDASVEKKFLTAAFGLVVAIAYLLVIVKTTGKPEHLFIAALSLLAVVSMVTMALMLLTEGDLGTAARRILVSAEHCIETYIWMALAYDIMYRGVRAHVVFAGYTVFVAALPWALSFDLFYLAGLQNVVGTSLTLFPILTVALLVVAFGVIGLLLSCVMRLAATTSTVRDSQVQAVDAPEAAAIAADAGRNAVEMALGSTDVTQRERDVAVLVYRGYSAKRIANELSLSEQTVKSYTSRVYRKLGIHSKQAFIALIEGQRPEG